MDYEMLKARANLDDAIHVITSDPPPIRLQRFLHPADIVIGFEAA